MSSEISFVSNNIGLQDKIYYEVLRGVLMSKVSVIYWSNGGNVEVLANTIADELVD